MSLATRRAHLREVVLGWPFDPCKAWTAPIAESDRTLRVLRFGSCELRAMDASHGSHTPIGYPGVLAGHLADRRTQLEFQQVFCFDYESLPTNAAALDAALALDGPPDVVIIEAGASYAIRRIGPNSEDMNAFRENLGRWLGTRIFLAWRVIGPVLRAFGEPFGREYQGTGALEAFVSLVRERWPGTDIALMEMLPVPPGLGWADPGVRRRILEDQRRAARRTGIASIRMPESLASPRTRCANRYNPNTLGSQIMGRQLYEWIDGRARHAR